MKMRGFKSLTGKLLAIYLTLVAVSVFFLFSILEFRTFLADRDKLLEDLQSVLTIQSSPVEAALWEVKAEEVRKIVNDIGALAQVEGVLVTTADGQLVASAGLGDAQPAKPEYQATRQLVFKSEFFEEPVGTLQITVHDRRIRDALIQRLKVDGAVLAFMIIVLGVGTIATTNLLIGRPLSRMLRSIDKFKRENVREQVEWQSADELGQVVDAYNEMQIAQAEAEGSLRKARDELELRVEERTRELAEAKDEAEAATRVKAAFLATMSHEIRTPMNGIIGMVDMMMQTKLGDDQHQMIRTVRDSGYALLTIINDILDFSKIEAGKLGLETIPLSIRDTLEGVAETLAPNANKKEIKINVHVDPNIPDALLGDQVRLRQILFNIAGNAVKFTDEGRVLMRAFLVPTQDEKKATIRFEIIDSGIGISKEAQSELFKEFSQAESSTTRRFGGTGLGLSICQRLIEMMNGKIEVESELGEGSKIIVTLTLPVAEEHAIKSDGHDLSGLKILSAEDDAEKRELDAEYLRHWGAKVTTIGGIREAKSLALDAAGQGTPFDIIAMSSAWPLETRFAEIEAMQAEKDLAGTRFALMTETRNSSR